MANPELVVIEINTINKVASAVTSGMVKVLDRNDLAYSETYRMAGQAAPLSPAEFFPINHAEVISSTSPIDVYIYAYSETRRGLTQIRIDL